MNAAEELHYLRDWSNELAGNVPQYYEATDGPQEAIISEWIADLMSDDLTRRDRALARGEWAGMA